MYHYLLTAIFDFFIASLAAFKKQKGFSVSFTAASFGVWQIELFFLSSIGNLEILNPLFHVTRWGMFLIPFCFVILTYQVVGIQSKGFKYAVIFPSAAYSIGLCLLNTFVFPSELVGDNGVYIPKVDFIYYGFIAALIGCAIISMGYIGIKYKHAANRNKQNIKWMLFTLIVIVITGLAASVLMHFNSYLQKLSAAFTNLIFIASMYYTTSVQEKMEIPKAFLVTATKLFILSIFIFIFFLIASSIGEIVFSISSILMLSFYLYFVIYSYPLLLDKLLPVATRAVSSDFYDIEEDKKQLSKMINESTTINELAQILDHFLKLRLHLSTFKLMLVNSTSEEISPSTNNIIHVLTDTTPALKESAVKLEHYLLKDEVSPTLQQELDQLGCEAIFPIFNDTTPIAILTTGKIANRGYYVNEDKQLLEFLCLELGKTLPRINKFESTQDALAEARKTLSLVGVMNQYHHDIKTPLAIIDGVISEDIYDQDKQKTIVLEQVERGTRLIATMASILRGKRSSKLSLINLENILLDSLFIFESRFTEIKTEFLAQKEIFGDAIDLKILFVNLIKNAAEAAASSRENTLHIKTLDDNEFVYVTITDTGTGIDKEKLDKLLVEGQLDTTKTTGSGVGLQAVKRIADEHNAELRIESRSDQGTQFSLRFEQPKE